MINLDKRLKACADFVTEGGVVCDVGTDHAYLTAYLIERGRCRKAIATDIHEGPLEAAKTTLKRHGLIDRVSLCLTDGLQGIPFESVTDVVIAGMGAELICEILGGTPWIRQGVNLVLQPMTKVPVLRRWLYENGFEIFREKAVQCDHYLYTVMQVRYAGRRMRISDVTAHIGKLNLLDEAGRAYAEKQAYRLLKAAEGLKKARQGTEDKINAYCTTARQIRTLLEAEGC